MGTGNTYVIKIGAPGSEQTVAGQLSGTVSVNGAPVDITNKASGGYIEYLDAFVAGKQVAWDGSLILSQDAGQNQLKKDIASGTQFAATIETGIAQESWDGTFVALNRSDSAPLNDKIEMSVQIATSGVYTYNEPVDPV